MKKKQEETIIFGLRYDTIFKNVFGKKENMKKLLEDIFEEKIEDFCYMNKESRKENKNLKYGICDIVLETPKEFIIVEMQNKDLKNIGPRMAMYSSRLYSNQNPGNDYKEMKPVKEILILNYEFGKKNSLKRYQKQEITTKETLGEYWNTKIWNLKEAIKETGIGSEYAKLFCLDQYSLEESQKILKQLKRKKLKK